jgi:Cu-Zn family superoxide dismutase
VIALCSAVACRGQIYPGAEGQVVDVNGVNGNGVNGNGVNGAVANGDLADVTGQVVMRLSTGKRLGTLRVQDVNGVARVYGSLAGVPAGEHGIHLHEIGVCDAPAFERAGAHFNPRGRKHGLDNPEGPHAGDAPNLVSNDSLRAVVDVRFAQPANGTNHSGLWDADGASVVIHAEPDDQKTDPAGGSGARIACGVVTRTR